MRFSPLRTRLILVFLAACVCLPLLAAPMGAWAQGDELSCASWQELYELIWNIDDAAYLEKKFPAYNGQPINTIRLVSETGVFDVDKDLRTYGGRNKLLPARPITLDLGDNSLTTTYPVYIDGPVTIRGTGRERPVVHVKNGQSITLLGGSIIATGELPATTDEALASPTGAQTQPPVALRVDYGGNIDLKGSQVLATGAGAIAVDWEKAPASLGLWATITAMGEGGIAIRILDVAMLSAVKNLNISYCDITGPVVAPDDVTITFIGCRTDAHNLPQNAKYTVSRAKVPVDADSSLPFLKVLCPANGQPSLPQALGFTLFYDNGAGGFPERKDTSKSVIWDMNSVDWTTPGEYKLKGTASMYVNTLPIEGLYAFEVDCAVYNPAGIYLPYGETFSVFANRISTYYLRIPVLPLYENSNAAAGDGLKLILYCSTDEGATWAKQQLVDESYEAAYTQEFKSFVLPSEFLAAMKSNGDPYWFYTALVDENDVVLKESNNLILQYDGKEMNSGYGGDRDLGDRDSEEKLPTSAPPSNDFAAINGTPGAAEGGAQGGSASTRFPGTQQAGPPALQEDESNARDIAAPGTQASIPLGGIAEDAASRLPQGHSYARQHLEDIMAANPENVTFYENGVRLLIPTKELAELLGGADELHISASPPQDEHVTFRLFTDGEELHLLSQGMEVGFAYDLPQSEPGTLYLVYGDTWIEARYEDGMAYATIYAMGEYTLVFRPAQLQDVASLPDTLHMQQGGDGTLPDSEAARGDFPIWPVAGGAGIAAMGGGSYWAQVRKRSRHRK